MNEIMQYQPQTIDIEEIKRIATMMVYSNFFASDSDQNRAIAQIGVKILAGREMGYGAFASVQGIHVIQGKPTLSANLMAAAVKAHPRYNYKVTVMTDDEVSIQFYEDGQPSGVSAFTKKDAQAAGLLGKDIWKKFPRNMLFSRALSNGVRWFTPDVFNGNTMYTPEEIDADVTIDMATGDVIPNGRPQPAPKVEAPQTAQSAPKLVPPLEKKEAPKTTAPIGFSDVGAALKWGFDSGVFSHMNHCQNAYDKLKEEKKPKSADAMWGLWIAEISNRLATAELPQAA